jgi:uncharacterized protein (DUF362 family)
VAEPGTSRTASWLTTCEEMDRALIAIVDNASIQVSDTQKNRNWIDDACSEATNFVHSNANRRHVLIKTSTAGGRHPLHEVSASLLDCLICHFRSAYPGIRITIADGPAYASYVSESHRLGWASVADRYGVAVVDLNETTGQVAIPGWKISQFFLEADVIINVTRAKTHRRFGVSLAEKALLGVIVPERPGYPKLIGRHTEVVWLMAELERISPPLYSIIDGSPGVQGEGPLAGTAAPSHFAVYGEGCFAPDLRAILEMGFDPLLVPSTCRPVRLPDSSSPIVPWAQKRSTFCDFQPPISCSWLYRSLHTTRHRQRRYLNLLSGARKCWPSAILVI